MSRRSVRLLRCFRRLISAAVVFFAVDLWRRTVDAGRLLGDRGRPVALGVGPRRLDGIGVARDPCSRVGERRRVHPGVQPALLLGTILAAVLAGWPAACRRVFDRVPLELVMAFFYWRAVFGALLIAGYAAGRLPAGFAIPVGLGDIAVTMLMILVLAVRPASGRYSARPHFCFGMPLGSSIC